MIPYMQRLRWIVLTLLTLAVIAICCVTTLTPEGQWSPDSTVDDLHSRILETEVAITPTASETTLRSAIDTERHVRIVDRQGRAIAHAVVLVHRHATRCILIDDTVARIPSDARGVAVLPVIAEPAVEATAIAEGFLSRSIDRNTNEVVLDRASLVHITVQDVTGNPVPGVQIALSTCTVPQTWEKMVIAGCASGPDVITVRRTTFDGSSTFDVAPDTDYWANIGGADYVRAHDQSEPIRVPRDGGKHVVITVGVVLAAVVDAGDQFVETVELEEDRFVSLDASNDLVRSRLAVAERYPGAIAVFCVGHELAMISSGHDAMARITFAGGEVESRRMRMQPVDRLTETRVSPTQPLASGELRVCIGAGGHELPGVHLNLIQVTDDRKHTRGRARISMTSGCWKRVPVGRYRVGFVTPILGKAEWIANQECIVAMGARKDVLLETSFALCHIRVRVSDDRGLAPAYAVLDIAEVGGAHIVVRSSKPQAIEALVPCKKLAFTASVYGRRPSRVESDATWSVGGCQIQVPVGGPQ